MKLLNVTFNKETFVIDIVHTQSETSEIKIVICDMQTDIPYYKFTEVMPPGHTFWIFPIANALADILKQSKTFPGFVCKVYKNNRLEQIEYLHTDYKTFEYKTFITNEFDGVGNSYIDFFYGTLCDMIDFGGTVIDAGANVGFFTWLAKERGAKRVYSIEPDIQANFYLEKNFRNDPAIILIKKALTSNLEGTNFYYCLNGTVANSTTTSEVHTYVKDYVPTINLDMILNIEEKINLIKLDIEGSEFEVFEHLQPHQFSKVNQFFIEFHRNSIPIKDKLIENGFTVQYKNSDETSEMGFIYAYR